MTKQTFLNYFICGFIWHTQVHPPLSSVLSEIWIQLVSNNNKRKHVFPACVTQSLNHGVVLFKSIENKHSWFQF